MGIAINDSDLAVASSVDLGQDVQITMPSRELPLVIQATQNVNVMAWGKEYQKPLNDLLLEHGALLLRGFGIDDAQGFNTLFSVLSGDAMEYKNRTSPRDRIYGNVYTSTSHPRDQQIYMHTENSYSKTFNRIIAFYCLTPSTKGGETPIADERRLLRSLKDETVRKFRERGIMYLRNTMPGVGLHWKTIYQTDDKNVVNQFLKASGFDYTWVSEDHLRVRWVLPAFQPHPLTGEEMWFNHMYFGLKNHYDPAILDYFAEEDLPFATYYGDGSEIEESVVKEFVDFYANHSIVFKWKKNDFLLLDNMRYAHGRKPFEGDRVILTAMGQPCTV